MIDALVTSFSGQGAAFMYAITAILALTLAIAFERGFLYWVGWRADRDGVLAALQRGELEQAASLAQGHPCARLVRAGADAPDADAAWDAMGSAAALVEEEVRRRVAWLATAGNIATMLGLLGTIYGLIMAFQGLSDASTVERSVRISEGIATAMTTTAWGLIVGIPALAVHAVLDGKAARELAWCEAAAGLVARSKRGAR